MKNNFQSIKRISGIFFISLMIFGCTSNEVRESKQSSPKDATISKKNPIKFHKPGSSFSDTLVIEGAAAVFYNPDSQQLLQIKAISPPATFQSQTHEFFFQMRNARRFLKRDWPNLKVIETNLFRFLLFRIKGRQAYIIDLDGYPAYSGIFLYKEGKKPHEIDMMNVETELYYYYQ